MRKFPKEGRQCLHPICKAKVDRAAITATKEPMLVTILALTNGTTTGENEMGANTEILAPSFQQAIMVGAVRFALGVDPIKVKEILRPTWPQIIDSFHIKLRKKPGIDVWKMLWLITSSSL